MALNFIDSEANGVFVLSLYGRLELGDGTRILRDLIHDVVKMGKTKILLNLAEVIHIDSTGLGELVSSYSTVSRSGGQLKLLKLRPRAQELIQVTRLHTIFEIFDDEAAALQSFNTK
jgi:anti-sigma B factor antagonist